MTSTAKSSYGETKRLAISIPGLIRRFKLRISVTLLLVIMEGAAFLAFPLTIGFALNDLIADSYEGLYTIMMLSVGLLLVGTLRRFYDTRVYGNIYRSVSGELVARERLHGSSTSTISARSQLFTEFVEFLEHSIPDIIHNIINLSGTLIIIGFLDVRILGLCLAATCCSIVIYWVSSSRILSLNRGENDEFEQQVHCISHGRQNEIDAHYRRLMGWRIKLSDLETINFSGVWFSLSVALVGAVLLLGNSTEISVGLATSIIMYVFGFIESIVAFPLYFQQLVRLREIAGRLH